MSINETAREGKIKVSRGALFVTIIQGYCDSHGELGLAVITALWAFWEVKEGYLKWIGK